MAGCFGQEGGGVNLRPATIRAMSHSDPGQLAVDNVRSLSPYVPGKPIEELQRELGLDDIIKLASNENPFGPSPNARAAMRAALEDVWLYPDGSGHALKQKLAARLAVQPNQITL